MPSKQIDMPIHPGENERRSWRRPLTFTSIIPLGACDHRRLHNRLREREKAWLDRLPSVPDLHSFRLVAVPPNAQSEQTALLLNTVHDRPIEPHLKDLLKVIDEELRNALADVGIILAAKELHHALITHQTMVQTFHLGAINQSLRNIRQERHLRQTLQQYADNQLASGAWTRNIPPETMWRKARDFVQGSADPDLPAGPAETISAEGRVRRFVSLLVSFAFPAMGVLAKDIAAAIQAISDRSTYWTARIAFGLWWIYGAVPTALALVLVRLTEAVESHPVAPDPDIEKVRRLEAKEDHRLKNAVTLWFPVKDSGVRRLLLRMILWGSERGCRHFWTRGALADIDTIHYARIMQVDGGRTLLFMSDYDGSLNRYLDDFLGVGSRAVIPISSNAAGCPKTRWLFKPADPQTFGPRWRSLIRTCQLEIAVWYSAYPDLTVRDILKNHNIREGLFAEDTDRETARKWLQLL